MNNSQRDSDSRGTGQGQRAADGQRPQQSQPSQQSQQPQQSQQSQPEQSKQQSQQNVYGEGNYQATRDYNARTKQFIESGRVDEAARDAAPNSEAEAREMAAAEAEGKRHAKEEDPEITLPESDLGPEDTDTPRPGKED
jgi:hypothetical protein